MVLAGGAGAATLAALVVVALVAGRGPPGGAAQPVAAGGGSAANSPGPQLPATGPAQDAPSLRGVVVDAAGEAVSQAVVTALREAESAEKAPLAEEGGLETTPAAVAVCDAEGAFALVGLEAGEYRVRVEGQGIFTAEARFVPVPGERVKLLVTREVEVAGVVVDGERGAGGIAVRLVDQEGGTVAQGRSDDQGHFAFAKLPEGLYRATAAKGQRASRAAQVVRFGKGPFAPVRLELGPAALVKGRVIDKKTGRGIAAWVRLVAEDAAEPPRHARAEETGWFEVDGVVPGRWRAEAYAVGYIALESLSFAAGGDFSLLLELTPGAVVEGRVVDPDGVAVSDATISVVGSDAAGPERVVSLFSEQKTQQQYRGEPRWQGPRRFIPRGELGVVLGPIPFPPAAGGGAVRPTSIVEDAEENDLPAHRDISEQPHELASRFITAANGNFLVTGLLPGNYRVVVDHEDFAPGRSKPFTVKLGRRVTGLQIVLARGVRLTGRVTNSRGEAVVGAAVIAEPSDQSGRVHRAVTKEDGTYELGPVGSAFRLSVTALGHGEESRLIKLGREELATEEREENIRLEVADAVLAGRVADPSGFAVRSARVAIDKPRREAVTDEYGRFVLSNLAPRRHVLRLTHPDFPTLATEAVPEQTSELILPYGGGIAVEVRDANTQAPLPRVRIVARGPSSAQRELLLADEASGELAALAPGRWQLRVTADQYVAETRVVEVPAGSKPGEITVRDLRIEMARGATLAGTVRNENGERVAGAQVRVGDASAASDENGRFRLADVPTGAVEIIAVRGDARGRLRLRLHPGDELATVEIVLGQER